MMKLKMIFFLALFSCTSKVKEGAEIHIYNETKSDIFVIDKYTLDKKTNKYIKLFGRGFDINRKKNLIYLYPEYVTMYTNKTIFFPINDYNNNKVYDALIFYIIKKDDLNKTKQEIIANKLYDSISISLKNFHQEGNDNHLYIEEHKIEFKNY